MAAFFVRLEIFPRTNGEREICNPSGSNDEAESRSIPGLVLRAAATCIRLPERLDLIPFRSPKHMPRVIMEIPLRFTSTMRRSLCALDLVNLLQADVGAGLGPFLAIYLMASRGWKPEMIGLALAAQGYATVAAQTPAGALVDWIRPKRLAIAIAAIVIGIGAVVVVRVDGIAAVVGAQIVIGLASVVIPPAIAAISLGLVGRPGFARRAGRNKAFDHAGNLMAAVTCGAAGYFFNPSWIFYMAGLISGATALAALAINENESITRWRARLRPPITAGRAPLSRYGSLRDYRIAVFAPAPFYSTLPIAPCCRCSVCVCPPDTRMKRRCTCRYASWWRN